MRRIILCAALVSVSGVAAAAQEPADDPPAIPPESLPLFASHEVLSLTLTGDLTKLRKDRREDAEEHPARLSFVAGDSLVALEVQLRTRGKLRLQPRVCGFPNFRVNFKKKAVRGTIFDGQDKLKVVGHCQDRDEYAENTVEEYLAYRILNLLTDVSYRVRLARVTYVDTHDARPDSLTRFAFFIEDEEHVAARHGLVALKVPGVHPTQADWEYLNLVGVFQYMIGNTDWSAFMPEPGNPECCHNTQPIGTNWGAVKPVPYDFDVTGLVNPRYAVPDPRLRIRNVRQRLYRGFCGSPAALQPVLARFNERRDAVYALYRETPGLREKTVEQTLQYFDKFYDVINDPKAVERELHRRCRQVG